MTTAGYKVMFILLHAIGIDLIRKASGISRWFLVFVIFRYYSLFLPSLLEACNDASADVRQVGFLHAWFL